jgi:hypothetical protein
MPGRVDDLSALPVEENGLRGAEGERRERRKENEVPHSHTATDGGVECKDAGVCLQGLQEQDQLLPLFGGQSVKRRRNVARLAAMAADGVLQRQRCQVVHDSRFRAETP